MIRNKKYMSRKKWKALKKKKREYQELRVLQKGKTRKEILAEMDKKKKDYLNKDKLGLCQTGFIPGVYFLFKGDELVYIGESNCIMVRIAKHYTEKDFTHYKIFAGIDNERARKDMEKILIKRYRPILNVVHNANVSLKIDKRQVRG